MHEELTVKKMLCCLVIACTVWTHRILLLPDTVKIAGQKRTEAHP